jgi:hypothetical protein
MGYGEYHCTSFKYISTYRINPYTTYEVQVANICNGETTVVLSNLKYLLRKERVSCLLRDFNSNYSTTAQVTWDPFPGATYILRYRKVGIPSWTMVPSNTNTITLTGLLELTKYEMQVANVCSGTPGTYTLPYFFTTPTIVYCQMASTGAITSEYISKVTVTPKVNLR